MSLKHVNASNGSGEAVRATVTAIRAAGSTTITVDALTNWPNFFIATSGTALADGSLSPGTVLVFAGHKSGSQIIIDTVAPGYTDAGNTVGQVVVVKPSTMWADNIHDVLAESHNDDGSLKTNSVTTAAMANGAVTAAKIETQQSWQTVAYAAGWGNYDAGTEWSGGRYMKDSVGIVHLAGLIKNTSGSTKTGGQLFTLPVGYRPLFKMRFNSAFSGSGGAIDVQPDGIVTTTASIANGDWISLSNVSFKAG